MQGVHSSGLSSSLRFRLSPKRFLLLCLYTSLYLGVRVFRKRVENILLTRSPYTKFARVLVG